MQNVAIQNAEVGIHQNSEVGIVAMIDGTSTVLEYSSMHLPLAPYAHAARRLILSHTAANDDAVNFISCYLRL